MSIQNLACLASILPWLWSQNGKLNSAYIACITQLKEGVAIVICVLFQIRIFNNQKWFSEQT
jgi:hypothetical protein